MEHIRKLERSGRITSLRQKTMDHPRYVSVDQARIITRVYQAHEAFPVSVKRAMSLAASLRDIPISLDPEELLVGNRTPEIRAGVVFPEAAPPEITMLRPQRTAAARRSVIAGESVPASRISSRRKGTDRVRRMETTGERLNGWMTACNLLPSARRTSTSSPRTTPSSTAR